jgi:hypothetical protein
VCHARPLPSPQPDLAQELKAKHMELLKTIETSLALATAAQAAQDEVESLKMQLKVAKAQYTTWANTTEADHSKTVASLKDEVKTLISDVKVLVNRVAAEKRDRIVAEGTHKIVYHQYEEKCNLIRQMGKNHDAHVKLLNDRIESMKMVQLEVDALKASLTAEKDKNKALVDMLESMRVVEPLPYSFVSPINVFDVFEPTCVRCKKAVSTHTGTVCV